MPHANGSALLLAPARPSEAALDAVRTAEALADDLAAYAAESDRHGAYPEREMDALRDAGLLAAPLPEDEGGVGLGTAKGSLHALLLVLRAVGRGSLPAGRLYEGHVNALVLLDLFGTDAQRARAAADARAGRLFGVWNTGAGDDVRLRPRPGGGVRLEGAKVFCSGVGRVTRPIVPGALPDGGWQMTLVPTDEVEAEADPAWWRAEGMRASASGRVDFTGVELGSEGVVGEAGDYLREPHFNGGAVRFTAVQLGAADALFEAAVAHLRRLDRLEHPVQQVRLGEVAALVETGGLWLLGAARLLERDDADAAAQVAYAQMARTAIERVCLGVLERTDRAVGARGLLPPSPVERIGRDLRLYLRQPNPDGAAAAAGAYAAAHPRRPLGSDPLP